MCRMLLLSKTDKLNNGQICHISIEEEVSVFEKEGKQDRKKEEEDHGKGMAAVFNVRDPDRAGDIV